MIRFALNSNLLRHKSVCRQIYSGLAALLMLSLLAGCGSMRGPLGGPRGNAPRMPTIAQSGSVTQPPRQLAGTGQYIRPEYMNPVNPPIPRIPPVDACRSQLYQGLVGQAEGAIFIAGLPGLKRVIKPAFDEEYNYSQQDMLGRAPLYVQVNDYLPGQSLYAPSIRTVADLSLLGEVRRDRLTLELDNDGLVQEVRCG